MSDDKQKVGQPDRIRVSATEAYEVKYLAEKYGVPKAVVEEVIKRHGPLRKDVEAQLERMKPSAAH